ncbi:MAG TPA: hypothetical protein VFA52_01800 [Candidatus Paceibacterota bacterium]|nr:hypothetical protein [Candidatus Paceibacterota bacterium]
MKLPHDLEKLRKLRLKISDLKLFILERRKVLRNHRDQRLDDRCWLDDYLLFAFLDDSPPTPTRLPPFHLMMKECGSFYFHCRADEADPVPADAILDPLEWDRDLEIVNEHDFFMHLHSMQQGFLILREIKSRPKTVDDYRRLYSTLPEKLPADFRLPPEPDFLGERKAPYAGCPSFWRSHNVCKGPCCLDRWGPCDQIALRQIEASLKR